MVYYARKQMLGYVVLVGVVFMGAVLTSYARARAESLIPTCKIGFMERPERIVLLIIGALVEPDGGSIVGSGRARKLDCHRSDLLHLEGIPKSKGAEISRISAFCKGTHAFS